MGGWGMGGWADGVIGGSGDRGMAGWWDGGIGGSINILP